MESHYKTLRQTMNR